MNTVPYTSTLTLFCTIATTGEAQCVLDTKYKTPETPSPDDIAKVAAYAEVKDCEEAFLVYPTSLANPVEARIGHVRVRSLPFSLDGDIEEAGQTFMEGLSQSISS